jgi:outer membrane receptor protein involved in Fe transport
MTGVRATGNVIPNPDAVDQFNVQTNNFSAQYGRTGAGVVSVLTKSGTNQVHGSVFEFHQETNFNANSYLQTTRTPGHINRFGATVGGPVMKNKVFLFGSYGGLRQVSPQDFNTVVTDALQRVGNFSENLPATAQPRAWEDVPRNCLPLIVRIRTTEEGSSSATDINVQGTPSLPNISVANFFTLANAISGPIAGDNIYGLRGVFSTTKGRHTINAGCEIYLEKDRLETLLNDYGTFSFTSAAVPTTASGQASYTRTGVAMADFLIGHPNTMGQDSPDDANENYWNYGLFVQDDWRVMPRLTLNLGLRYDVQTAPTDTQRRIAVFEPGVQSTVSPNAMLGQLFPGDPGVPDGGVDTNYNHLSPRVGFAYDAAGNGRTVFHGGAGLFFDTISGNEWMLSQNFQPFAVRETNAFTHVVSLQHIYSTDCQDFAGCVSPFPYLYDKANPKYVSPASLVFMQKGMRWPLTTSTTSVCSTSSRMTSRSV